MSDQIKVELQDTMGTDRSIAEAAWTSSYEYEKKKNRDDDDVSRVVNMLADLRHSVPFESVVFRFWIKMPIATDRQFMTHRLQSASGLSGRYRTMPSEWLNIPNDVHEILDKLGELGKHMREAYKQSCSTANALYSADISVCKIERDCGNISEKEFKRLREFYRGILPQHNMTERVSIMNLRAFGNFQYLRNSEHAQPEIRQIAKLMLKQVEDANICPIAIEALKRNGWKI